MFASVLVANRGEIAVRIMRTLSALGVRSIAVYTDADAGALHVRLADDAVRLGSADGYLDVERVIAAAVATGAEAVHPGYGFLSEQVALAVRCAETGIAFVGPPPPAIEIMGDKINAKRTVAAAGVPVVPGLGRAGLSDAELEAAARQVGLPVLLKPSAGGGGKGMRRVDDADQLPAEIAAARREARVAFGDDTLLVERWVTRPRHIEIQVFADSSGACVHLGERECSLQRRHQKIVEEAPSPLLDEATRRAMGAAAIAAAQAVSYVGAGTVEFIVSADRPDEYFFMEMNTRLQVEHAVTEMVTGIDLVELQLRVAAGEPLGFTQDDVVVRGHSIEARLYAEDPSRGFLPATGTVLALDEPGGRAGVRVDSGLQVGTVVGAAYDPMLAKVIATGRDRPEALDRLVAALGATTVLGVTTNVAFLRRLLRHPDVRSGHLDTELVERHAADLAVPAIPPDVLIAAGVHHVLALQGDLGPTGGYLRPGGPDPRDADPRDADPRGVDPWGADPWSAADGWRVGEHAETGVELTAGLEPHTVAVRGRPGPLSDAASARRPGGPAADGATVRLDDGVSVPVAAHHRGDHLVVDLDGRTRTYVWATAGDILWLGREGGSWPVGHRVRYQGSAAATATRRGPVTSPMPGTVGAVMVAVGDVVRAGQALVTVEAMKMEYTVSAPADGTVTALLVRPGQQVTLDEALAEVEPAVEATIAPEAPAGKGAS